MSRCKMMTLVGLTGSNVATTWLSSDRIDRNSFSSVFSVIVIKSLKSKVP